MGQSGSFFGELALLKDARRTATARVVAGGGPADLLRLDKEEFAHIRDDIQANEYADIVPMHG